MCYPEEEEYRRIYRSLKLSTLVSNLEGIFDTYDSRKCEFFIGVRTPKIRWKHPLFTRAKKVGVTVERNLQFDDWSGMVGDLLDNEQLIRRPLRAKRLPCTMTFSGPHFRSDGSATACGCRDLDRSVGLALEPESLLSDMLDVYKRGKVAALREKFRSQEAPEVCVTCRHYNPQYAGESLSLRLKQLWADFLAPFASERVVPPTNLVQISKSRSRSANAQSLE